METLILVLTSKLKMSFKSILRYMKKRFWNICSNAFGSRAMSQWVIDVDDSSVEAIDDSNQSCWANIPPELLTEVVMKIEAMGMKDCWCFPKYVVSCAGVCRSWRKTMKEIAKRPPFSGQLTFPMSIKQPGGSVDSPPGYVIERDIDNHIYYLHVRALYHEGKRVLAAKRVRYATCIEYIISLNFKDISKGTSTYVGMLRSNFLGTRFTVYDAHPPNAATKCDWPKVPAGNFPVSSISYKVNALGNRGPREMRCQINTIHANSFSLSPLLNLKDVKLLLKNGKRPRWHSRLWCWCLSYFGRVTFPSVKNFQLVACLDNEVGVKEQEDIILEFRRFDEELFDMDYQYPISAFQAFAICLSTFDTKVACD